MRALRADRAEGSYRGVLTLRARGSREPASTAQGPGTRYQLSNPRITIDRHRSGSHAGLQHLTCDLLDHGVKIGELDVHLHHNKRGLSVGSTLLVFSGAVGGNK